MEILKTIFRLLIKEAKAQISIDPGLGQTMCYLGTADLENTVTDIVQWVLMLLSPIMAIILAIKNGYNLLKKKTFSLSYAVYKSMLRVIILTVIFSVLWISLIFMVNTSTVVTGEGYETASIIDFYDILIPIATTLLLISIPTGIVYLFFIKKNKIFLKLALSFVFVIPSIIIFITVIIMNLIPSYRNLLPPDAILTKKKDLQEKLIHEGKLPIDPEQKNE